MATSRTADELAVLAVIQSFSNSIKSNSPEALHSMTVTSGTVTRASVGSNGQTELVHVTLSDLVNYISGAADRAPIEGRFDPDEVTVKTDGKVAVVWAPWKSYANDKLSHTGNLIFVLAKEDEKWIIVSNADSLIAV